MELNNSTLNQQSPSLYNGNIRHMSIHNRALGDPIAYSYKYDQLHRIRQMQSVENADITAYQWKAAGNTVNYGMSATYDGNGNILELTRDGIQQNSSVSTRVHDLEYTYAPGTNLLMSTLDSGMVLTCVDDVTIDHTPTQTDPSPTSDGMLIASTNTLTLSARIDGCLLYTSDAADE